MSAPSSAKGSPTQGDSQATSFNAPGAQPDLAEIQAQQLAQAGLIADLQTKVGNLDTKMDAHMNAMDAKFEAILARLDRAPETRPTSAVDAAAAKAAAEKADEAKREQEALEIDKEIKRLQQLARERRAGNSPKADPAGHRDPEQQLAEHRARPTDPTRDHEQAGHRDPEQQLAEHRARPTDPTNTDEGYALEFLHGSHPPAILATSTAPLAVTLGQDAASEDVTHQKRLLLCYSPQQQQYASLQESTTLKRLPRSPPLRERLHGHHGVFRCFHEAGD